MNKSDFSWRFFLLCLIMATNSCWLVKQMEEISLCNGITAFLKGKEGLLENLRSLCNTSSLNLFFVFSLRAD